MINNFDLFIVLGFLAVFLFFIYERVRSMTGKVMLTEKLIVFLEKVHQRTEPQNLENDAQTYQLTERIVVKRVYFDGKN